MLLCRVLGVGAALLCMAIPGCTRWDRSVRVERQHEAGAVHFAVLSAGHWEEFAAALQPKFEIDERMALEAVIPTTQVLEESMLHLMQVSAGATNVDATTTQTKSESVDGDNTVTENVENRPQTADEIKPSTSLSLYDDKGPRRPSPAPLNQPVGLDPMMRYWAATALYQEVRLLNQYIEKAAIREGFVPYVVRLQVSLMPAARNEPYDVYTTFSFFTAAEVHADSPGSDLAGAPPTILRATENTAARRRTPQIVPLMTTDNLEARLHSQMIETIQQLAGSVFFMAGQATGAVEGQDVQREQSGKLGRDLNSLLTVARVSDNSLRVRLGAQQQVASEYAMVPRNHNLTVLVMVPEGTGKTLQVVAKTTMVDAQTGEKLRERTEREIEAEYALIADRYAIDARNIPQLLALAQRNDQKAFFAALEQREGQRRFAQSLWVDIVSLMIGSQYAATEFDLPSGGDADVYPEIPEQTGLLLDDGKKATLLLRGRGRLKPTDIEATLLIREAASTTPWVSSQAVVDSLRNDVFMEFPSLRAWGMTTEASTPEMILSLTVAGEESELTVRYRFQASGS